MNCSTNFDLFDENVSDLISVSANVAFTFTTALIFYLSVRNFGGTFYRLLFKLDNFVSIVIILNGVVAIFSALEATLTFCRFSSGFVANVVTCFNGVVILPTFYVACVFKCRSKRRFLTNVFFVATFYCIVALFRLYELSERLETFKSVRSTLSIFSLALNVIICVLFFVNFAINLIKTSSTLLPEVAFKCCSINTFAA